MAKKNDSFAGATAKKTKKTVSFAGYENQEKDTNAVQPQLQNPWGNVTAAKVYDKSPLQLQSNPVDPYQPYQAGVNNGTVVNGYVPSGTQLMQNGVPNALYNPNAPMRGLTQQKQAEDYYYKNLQDWLNSTTPGYERQVNAGQYQQGLDKLVAESLGDPKKAFALQSQTFLENRTLPRGLRPMDMTEANRKTKIDFMDTRTGKMAVTYNGKLHGVEDTGLGSLYQAHNLTEAKQAQRMGIDPVTGMPVNTAWDQMTKDINRGRNYGNGTPAQYEDPTQRFAGDLKQNAINTVDYTMRQRKYGTADNEDDFRAGNSVESMSDGFLRTMKEKYTSLYNSLSDMDPEKQQALQQMGTYYADAYTESQEAEIAKMLMQRADKELQSRQAANSFANANKLNTADFEKAAVMALDNQRSRQEAEEYNKSIYNRAVALNANADSMDDATVEQECMALYAAWKREKEPGWDGTYPENWSDEFMQKYMMADILGGRTSHKDGSAPQDKASALYDFVMGDVTYEDLIENGSNPVAEDWRNRSYDMLSEEQKQRFDAYYQLYGEEKAQEYLNSIQGDLNRVQNILYRDYGTKAGQNAGGSAVSVMTNLMQAPVGFVRSLMNIGSMMGMDVGDLANEYNYLSNITNFTTGARAEGGARWGDTLDQEVLGQKLGTLLYNVVMSAVDSTVSAFAGQGMAYSLGAGQALGEQIGLFIMSSAASQQSFVDRVQSGEDINHATMASLFDGITEYLTEKLPFDNMLKQDGRYFLNVIKTSASEFLEEASGDVMKAAYEQAFEPEKFQEEFLTARIADPTLTVDQFYKQKFSEFCMEAFTDGVMGGLSGFLMGASGQGYQAYNDAQVGRMVMNGQKKTGNGLIYGTSADTAAKFVQDARNLTRQNVETVNAPEAPNKLNAPQPTVERGDFDAPAGTEAAPSAEQKALDDARAKLEAAKEKFNKNRNNRKNSLEYRDALREVAIAEANARRAAQESAPAAQQTLNAPQPTVDRNDFDAPAGTEAAPSAEQKALTAARNEQNKLNAPQPTVERGDFDAPAGTEAAPSAEQKALNAAQEKALAEEAARREAEQAREDRNAVDTPADTVARPAAEKAVERNQSASAAKVKDESTIAENPATENHSEPQQVHKPRNLSEAGLANVQRLVTIGLNVGGNASVKQLATKISKQIEKGSRVGAASVGRLYQEVYANVDAAGKETISNVLGDAIDTEISADEMGVKVKPEDREQLRKGISMAIMGGDLSAYRDIMARYLQLTQRIIDKFTRNENGIANKANEEMSNRYDTLETLDEMLVDDTAAHKAAQKSACAMVDAALASVEDATGRSVSLDGNRGEIVGMKVDGHGHMTATVVQEDGSTVEADAADLKYASPETAVMVAEINESAIAYTEQEANALLESYTGGNVQAHVKAFNAGYAAAFTGEEADMTNGSVKAGYEAGQADWQAAVKKRSENARKAAQNTNQGGRIIAGDGVSNKQLQRWLNNGSGMQASQVKLLQAVAKAANADIVLVDEGASEDGTLMGANGWYSSEDGRKIYVSVSAGHATAAQLARGTRFALSATAAHELTHMIENTSPEIWQELRQAVIQEMKHNGRSFDRFVASQAVTAMQGNGRLNRADLEAEVIADAMSGILMDEGAIQRMQENSSDTLWGKIREAAEKVYGRIAKLMQNIGRSGVHAEAMAIMRDGRYGENILDIWARGFGLQEKAMSAIENGVNMTSISDKAPASTMDSMMTDSEVRDMAVDGVMEAPAPNQKDGTTELSPRTWWTGDTMMFNGRVIEGKVSGRDNLIAMLKKRGMKQADIDARISFIDSVTKKFDEWGVKYQFLNLEQVKNATLMKDRNGGYTMTCVVKNAEYPINIDFSTICDKRADMTEFFNRLAIARGYNSQGSMLDEINLTPDNIRRINQILKEEGYETACFGCFVESKRFTVQKFAQDFVDMYNAAVDAVREEMHLSPAEDFAFAKGQAFTDDDVNNLTENLKAYTKGKSAGVDKGGTVAKRLDTLVRQSAAKGGQTMLRHLQVSDLITSAGLDEMAKYAPELMKVFNAHYGQGRPKNVRAYVPYNGEIGTFKMTRDTVARKLMTADMVGNPKFLEIKTDKNGNIQYEQDKEKNFILDDNGEKIPKYKIHTNAIITALYGNDPAFKGAAKNITTDRMITDYIRKIGGVRNQSFSDFIPSQLFDALQMIADCEGRGYSGQCYTKNQYRAWLLGMCGFKTNLSVMFLIDGNVNSAYAGLDENGDYLIADYEDVARRDENWQKSEAKQVQSFPMRKAVEIQRNPLYGKTCGAIGVGHSYNHMVKMMNDFDFPYIIGYHLSGMPVEVAEKTNIVKSADYTGVQNMLKMPASFMVVKNAGDYDAPSYATWGMDTAKDAKQKYSGMTPAEWIAKDYAKTGDYAVTMRNLLGFMQENSLTFSKTSNAEAGHGMFDLYEDLDRTGNPKETADNLIRYALERGQLPLFYEFTDNPYYFKNLFDFSVMDLSQMNAEDWATGAYADGTAIALAPQQAVSLGNLISSVGQDTFFTKAEKMLDQENRSREKLFGEGGTFDRTVKRIVDNGELRKDGVQFSPREEVEARDKDYFDNIEKHSPMVVTVVNEYKVPIKNGRVDTPSVLAAARKAKYVQSITNHGSPVYYAGCPDIASNVETDRNGLKHGFEAKKANDPVTPQMIDNAKAAANIGILLRNAVEVNRSNKYTDTDK
ncbi:MAG: hypothetical protein MJZ81_07935 [Bacteroidales bacterium]|nr:hypothetical protein [Bacteroidales bacterium]